MQENKTFQIWRKNKTWILDYTGLESTEIQDANR